MSVLLELEHLTKSYGAVKVVDDLSVSLHEGEALGVVGPNGAGKTTMLNLITGIVRPERGPRRVRGQGLWATCRRTSGAGRASAARTRSRARSRA